MNHCEYKSKIEQYLDEALTESEMLEVGKHIHRCSDCSKDVEILSEIESLVSSSSLFEPPPAEYWQHLPQEVADRLGLPARRSPVEQLLERAGVLFQSRKYRVALAGAFAAILLFFVVKTFEPETQITSTVPGPPSGTELQAEIEPHSAPLPQDEMQTEHYADDGAPVTAGAVAEAPQRSLPQSGKKSEGVLESHLAPVTALSARSTKVAEVDFSQELLPVPNYEYILEPDDVDNSKTSLANVQTLSHSVTGSAPQSVENPAVATKEMEEESDFAETLWIVQQSTSLLEKKNIWLSYIARETDKTYLSMGVYNMALVLAKIAEETRGEDEAQEAFDFFTKHEESLRFQMGEQRYNVKINALRMVIDRR